MPFSGSVRAAFVEVYGAGKRIVIDAASTLGAGIMFYMGYPYSNGSTPVPEDDSNVASIAAFPTNLPDLGRALELRGPLTRRGGFGALEAGTAIRLWADELVANQAWIGLETAMTALTFIYLQSPAIYLNGSDIVGAWPSFTPTVWQGNVVVPSIATNTSAYLVGKTFTVRYDILITGTVGPGVIEVSLPGTPMNVQNILSVGTFFMSGPGINQTSALGVLVTGIQRLRFVRSDQLIANYWGADPAYNLQNTARICGTITYERS